MKAAREAKGWSQSALANALGGSGLNQSAISRIESGERAVRLSEARAIARVFGTNVDALSGTPAAFEKVLRWNALSGEYDSALRTLEEATDRYERAREALSEYLRAPELGFTRQREEFLRHRASMDAGSVAMNVMANGLEPPF